MAFCLNLYHVCNRLVNFKKVIVLHSFAYKTQSLYYNTFLLYVTLADSAYTYVLLSLFKDYIDNKLAHTHTHTHTHTHAHAHRPHTHNTGSYYINKVIKDT